MGKIDRSFSEAARSLTGGLKAKNRRRREGLKLLAASSSPVRAPRNDLLPRLDLAYVLLEDLRTPAREVRKLDSAHVREVANSINTFGFCAPILVGKDNLVLDGAVRVQAARLLGRAPCIRIEYLSEKEERVLRLAVNRGEKGEWNLDELKIEFEELILADAPIEISGFTLDEIDQIVLGEADDAIERGPLAPDPDAIAVGSSVDFTG
jgi:ParB-like nuclease domain